MKGLKRVISLIILCVIMAGNLFSQGSSSKKYAPMATSDLTRLPLVSATGAKSETETAKDLGILPAGWESNRATEADFAGFYTMMTSLISLCDRSALSVWQQNVQADAFPHRTMKRDDGLVLLMLAAEALGYNVYNARDYGFCTENYVNYDLLFSQLSWDYPYCDAGREIDMFFPDGGEDPIGSVPISAVFWMQRRMDVHYHRHFFDGDKELVTCKE